jgi:proteasome lid subunit RPN8/RPN11
MKHELEINLSVYKTIILLLEERSSIEQIGLCFGSVSDQKGVKIEEFIEVENLDDSSTSFSLDYADLIKEVSKYQEKGKNFVGLFHSHPSGHSPLPSRKDIHYMQYWPSPFVWLIGVFPELLAFGFYQNKVFKIPYTLVEGV